VEIVHNTGEYWDEAFSGPMRVTDLERGTITKMVHGELQEMHTN
jgi:hypothetical protein